MGAATMSINEKMKGGDPEPVYYYSGPVPLSSASTTSDVTSTTVANGGRRSTDTSIFGLLFVILSIVLGN